MSAFFDRIWQEKELVTANRQKKEEERGWLLLWERAGGEKGCWYKYLFAESDPSGNTCSVR